MDIKNILILNQAIFNITAKSSYSIVHANFHYILYIDILDHHHHHQQSLKVNL